MEHEKRMRQKRLLASLSKQVQWRSDNESTKSDKCFY